VRVRLLLLLLRGRVVGRRQQWQLGHEAQRLYRLEVASYILPATAVVIVCERASEFVRVCASDIALRASATYS